MNTTPSGSQAVIMRRMDALAESIRARDWINVEFTYDQVRSALLREFEIDRGRPSDEIRKKEHPPGVNER